VSVSPASVYEYQAYSIQCTFPGYNVTSLQILLLTSPSVTVYNYNSSTSTDGTLHPDWKVAEMSS